MSKQINKQMKKATTTTKAAPKKKRTKAPKEATKENGNGNIVTPTKQTEAELEEVGRQQWEAATNPPPTSDEAIAAGWSELQRERRRRRRKLAHRANRARQRNGHLGRKAWRESPATDEQLAALRTIATATGNTFTTTITRGSAWRRIKKAETTIGDPVRNRCAPPWYTPKGTRPKVPA